MKDATGRIFLGLGLILVGGLFLVQQIFHFPIDVAPVIIAVIFALAGLAFIYVLTKSKENWWAAIPGFVLFGLGALIGSSQFFPMFTNHFGGSLFLAFMGLGFLVVLLIRPEHWWAVIPAGVLFTLALVAGIASFTDGFAAGASFFIGLGITFGVVGLMPIGRNEKWPWIPAAICLVFGSLLFMGSDSIAHSFFGYFWPAVLLLGGGYLIVRSLTKKGE